MACIYVLEFPNGKMYIGQTRYSHLDRFAGHIKYAKHSKNKLYNAWRKYGAPQIRVLLECSTQMLNFFERRAIQVYDTFKNGYNSTSGGDYDFSLDEEVRLKISNHMKMHMSDQEAYKKHVEKMNSPEVVAKLSELSKKQWLENPPVVNYNHSFPMKAKYASGWAPNLGKTRTVESRERMSIAGKNRPPASADCLRKLSAASSSLWERRKVWAEKSGFDGKLSSVTEAMIEGRN